MARVRLCSEDVNDDGVTDVLDLIDLLLCFGQPATPPCDTGQDINGDGDIDVLDLIELLLTSTTAAAMPRNVEIGCLLIRDNLLLAHPCPVCRPC